MSEDVIRLDVVDMSKARYTEEGWIRDEPVLTRAGIFEYREVNGSIRREFRPPEEVFSADSMNSLRGIPVTLGHPTKLVDAHNPDRNIGCVISEGRQDGNNMRGEIAIHNPGSMGDNKELSLGYRMKIDRTPGVWNGQNYDVVQRNIRYNHLAVVKAGRAGNARLRLDSEDNLQIETDNKEDPPTVAENLVSVRVDGLDYKASPEVSLRVSKLETANTDLQTRLDRAEAERDALKVKVDAHPAEIEKIRKDAADGLRARMSLEADAKKYGVEIRADQSDRQIRESVINKLRGNVTDFAGKSDDYVGATYDMTVSEGAKRQDSVSSQRSEANGGTRSDSSESKPNSNKIPSAAEARRKMLRYA